MIQCNKCGKMVKEGAPYCIWCGHLLSGSPGIAPVTEASPASFPGAGGDVRSGISRPEPSVPDVPPAVSRNAGKKVTLPRPYPADPETASSLAAEGNACAKLGNYDDALVLYEQALAIGPGNHKAWHNKGIVLKRLGDLKGAQECLEYARTLKESPEADREPAGAAPTKGTDNRSPGTTLCTRCGTPVPESSLFCPSCPREPENAGSIPAKNPRYAAVFSLLVPGLGQVYNGDTIRAILVLLGTIAGTFLLFIPGILIWIYGVVNAYRSAKRINAGQARVRARSDLFMILYVVVAVILVAAVFIIISAVIAAFTLGTAGLAPGSG